VDRQQWDDRYSGAEFEWSMHPNQFVAEQLVCCARNSEGDFC
jgi:hypothetical protein